MHPILRSLLLLAPLPTLVLPACGGGDSMASETGTGESTSPATGSTTSGGLGTSTGDPTTTQTDVSAGSSTGESATTGASATTTGETTTTGTTTGETTTGDSTTGAVEELPPIDSAEQLEAWLAGGAYKQWAAESQVHASTGPHGGNVRTYVNAIALGSLASQQSEHPQDAAVVKELYGGGVDTLIGYAVMRKTAPLSEGGANWYWYERIDANVYADGLDVGLCSGCHGAGADYILTPYPLQ